MGSTEGFGQLPGLFLFDWFNDQINTLFHWKITTIILVFFLGIPEPSKLCALLLFFLLSFFFFFSFLSSVVPGFCLPSGMVAPHLTACMRNDKMGEASVPQNQTTVCNCPPPLSGSLFRFPSSPLLSVSLLYHPDVCVCVWCGLGSSTPVHTNPFTQNALPVPPLP